MKPVSIVPLAVVLLLGCLAAANAAPGKPRLIVLTDIGGDPDDQQSMIRLLLYANEFQIEGLIASASGTIGELKEKVTKPHLIREIVEAYGKAHPNLIRHAEGYPAADTLLSRIKTGNPIRGREGIGPGQDTEGSRWIVEVVDREDPRPVNMTIWGGQTELAQALWRVRQDRGPAGLAEFIRKIRIYDIGDQDRIVEWLWQEFPGLFYLLGQAPAGRDMREAVYRGLYLGGDETLVSRQWMESHIRQAHGPLGALYPPRTWTAPNPHSAIKEGDTPSWFFFLPNGLGAPNHPEWGGWGGRFKPWKDRIFRDATDTVGRVTDARCTVWRWREQFQNDFAARLDWCVADSFDKANHNPLAVLNGNRTRDVLDLAANPGETIRLSAEGTSDPDGNEIEAQWWVYSEPSEGLTEPVRLTGTNGLTMTVRVPEVTNSATVHVILQVSDNGTPKLWAGRRAVIKVEPPRSRNRSPAAPSAAMPTLFELEVNKARQIRAMGPSGPIERNVRLLAVRESYWPNYHIPDLPQKRVFRSAEVEVDVSGTRATLRARPFETPKEVNGLRLYVETTRAWATELQLDPMPEVRGAVRFSCVAAGAPWAPSGLRFPIGDYRWRANTYNNTWLALVPYNRHYYHRGEDFGAIPDRLEVLASVTGVVARSPLPNGDGRSNGLMIRDPAGLEISYSHMNTETILSHLTNTAPIRAGEAVGRTGMTWSGRKSQHNDPHLHWALSVDGKAIASYPFMVEAYLRDYPDPLLAVAGGYHYATPGDTVELDASRSVARPGRRIVRYQWRLHDGREIETAHAKLKVDRPGLFSEELRVFADDGSEDRDFAQLRVWDMHPGARFAAGWFYHYPVRGAKAGTPILFWNRLYGTTGPVEIDFGDGSPPVWIDQQATHAYNQAGHYTAALRGRGPGDEPLEVQMRVVVEK